MWIQETHPVIPICDVIKSPAIVEENFTTIAIYPGWEAVVDDAGDYLLQTR